MPERDRTVDAGPKGSGMMHASDSRSETTQSNADSGPPALCKEDMEEFHASEEEAEVSEDEGLLQGSSGFGAEESRS